MSHAMMLMLRFSECDEGRGEDDDEVARKWKLKGNVVILYSERKTRDELLDRYAQIRLH